MRKFVVLEIGLFFWGLFFLIFFIVLFEFQVGKVEASSSMNDLNTAYNNQEKADTNFIMTNASHNTFADGGTTNVALSSLKVDGTTVSGFDPEVFEYTLPARPNSTEVINIEYETSDPKSTVTGDTGVQQLKEGNNTFVVVVKAESGASKTYRIHVQRDYPLPYLTDLSILSEKLLDSNYKTTEFAKEEYNYTAIVSYMTLHATIKTNVDNFYFNVTCSNSTVDTTGDFLRTFNVDLIEGLNTFAITVTSPEGKTVTYNLVIERRGKDSTNTNIIDVNIEEIPEFKNKYSNNIREYDLEVPNGIRNLTIAVTLEKFIDEDGVGATVRIINDKNLRVGKNKVFILVTTEDKETIRTVLLNVTRRKMSYTIDIHAYEDFVCEKQEGSDTRYAIKLVDKLAKDIKDYTKYIIFNDAEYDSTNQYVEKPEVIVLSNVLDKNCREVILKVFDGDQVELITFYLNYVFSIQTEIIVEGIIEDTFKAFSSYGTDRVIDIPTREGYYIDMLIVDGISIESLESYTFTSIIENHTVQIIFKPITYKVHFTTCGKGIVKSDKDLNNLAYNEDCSISLIPVSGYKLDFVLIDGKPIEVVNNEIMLQDIDKNIEIVVSFEEDSSILPFMWIIVGLGTMSIVLLGVVIFLWTSRQKRKKI